MYFRFHRFTSILLAGVAFGALSTAAQTPCVTIERTVAECAVPGVPVEVLLTVSSTCAESITALGVRDVLPDGWVYRGTTDAGEPQVDIAPASGATGVIEFAWVDVPAFPATISYLVEAPDSATTPATIEGNAVYRELAGEIAGANVATEVCVDNMGGGEGEGEGEASRPVIMLSGEAEVTIECGSEYTDAGATATDLEDGDLTASIVQSGFVDTREAGVYVVAFNVRDSHENQAVQVIRIVTVEDTTPPTIELVGAATIQHPCGMPYVDLGAFAMDACDGLLTVTVTGEVDIRTAGEYTMTYSAADSTGATVFVRRTVVVRDGEGPIITLAGDAPLRLSCDMPYVEAGATAIDACDGLAYEVVIDDTDVDDTTVGTYQVRYRAVDARGFVSVLTRDVIVSDTDAPIVELLGDNPLFLNCGERFVDPNAVATDICSGDVEVSSDAVSLIDTTEPGTFEITYTAVDASGNLGSATRTVIVGGPACGEGALFCDLASFVIEQPAVLDNTATVFIPEGDQARRILLSSSVTLNGTGQCRVGTVRVAHTVAGSTQFSQAGEDGFPVVYFLKAGEHTIFSTAEVLETGSRLERTTTVNVVAAPDADANGFVDQPFANLVDDGDSWSSDTLVSGTEGAVAMVTWFGACDDALRQPVTLRVRNPENVNQLLTVEVPHGILSCGEQGILAVAIGNRLDNVLSGGNVIPAAPGQLAGGPYFDISIIVSSDSGATFSSIAPGRLASDPVQFSLSGLALDGVQTPRFFHIPIEVNASGGGFSLQAASGTWAPVAATASADGSTLHATASDLSLFVPAGGTTEMPKEGGASCAPGTSTPANYALDLLIMVAMAMLLLTRKRVYRTMD